jgi:hypothetical protein
MKISVLVLGMVFGMQANAAVLIEETVSANIISAEAANFTCAPGVRPNGHNFPTASSFEIYIGTILPTSNMRTLGQIPFNEPLGDHCAELKEELNSRLPATLVIKRKITEQCTVLAGENVKTVTETLDAELAGYQLVNSEAFIAGPCTP